MTPKHKALQIVSALVAILALLLAACGPAATTEAPPPATEAPPPATEAPPPATQAPAPTEVAMDWSHATSAEEGGGMDALIAAAQEEGTVTTIALPHDWCNYGEVIETFKSTYGLEVNELDPNAGSNDELEAIKANKDNPGPQAPDVVDVGVAFGPTATDEGLITPYKVEGFDSIAGPKNEDGYWYADYGGVLVFQVNSDLVDPIPQDWADLLNPEYNGMVALAGDPRSSNQAAQTVMAAALANGGTLDDVGPGLDFFKQLNDAGNFVPVITDTGIFGKGEVAITFAWDYLGKAAADTFAGNPPVEIVYPQSGILGGFYVQAVSAYAPHPAAARLWQEFLYSDEGQQIWMKGYCVPSRFADMAARGVIAQELLDRMPAPEVMTAAIFPSVDQLSAMRARVAEEWDSAVGVDVVDTTP
ncbi:MAG TPA: extracellular solute-binding protein [Anaerolineales bacterium]|nr:extracellular solute-binding protein [Anaerolineales bacterium]